MRKGIFGFKGVTNLLLVALSIFVVVSAMTKVLAPHLGGETRTPSYENFQLLASAVDGLVSIKSQSAISRFVFELDPDFAVIGFQSNKDFTSCDGKDMTKPESCNKEACLCLFKFSKGEYKEVKRGCASFGDTLLISKIYEDDNPYKYVNCEFGLFNSPIIDTKTINNEEVKYKDISFFGSYKNELRLLYNDYDEAILGTIPLVLEVRTLSKGKKEVFIDRYTEDNLIRYKTINTCPTESDTQCVSQHYDYVFAENINGEDKKFACGFDQLKNKCMNENVEDCETGLVDEKCACGNIAYEFGFCIKENNVFTHKNKELPENYCFGNKIDACEKYKTDGNHESDKYACTFNICGVAEIGCYWDTKGLIVRGLKIDACEICPDSCDCNSLYDEEWVKETNPCRCECDPPSAQSTNPLQTTNPTVIPPYI